MDFEHTEKQKNKALAEGYSSVVAYVSSLFREDEESFDVEAILKMSIRQEVTIFWSNRRGTASKSI